MNLVVLRKATRRSYVKHLKTTTSSTSAGSPRVNNNITSLKNFDSWAKPISTRAQAEPGPPLALFLGFSKKLSSGTKPDGYALVKLVRASTDLGLNSYSRQLHGYLLKSGLAVLPFISNALLRHYKEEGSLDDAYNLFDENPKQNLLSWNTLITGFFNSEQFSKAWHLFRQFGRTRFYGDSYTFRPSLSACGQLGMLPLGRSIHCKIMKLRLQCDLVVANCLIDMYGKCGSLQEAIRVFDEMDEKDNFSWNCVIAASVRNQEPELASSFFFRMPVPDTVSYNEFINGISQFGDIDDAVEILKNMPRPNPSSWNSILKGCFDRYEATKAFDLVTKMQSSDVKMDEYTCSIILNGAADLADLTWGTLIHCFTVKDGFDVSVVVGTSLMVMYSKCWHLKDAEVVFNSVLNKNIMAWNTMISGYARNGNSLKVIQLFEEMKMVKHVKPDWVISCNVIDACLKGQVPSENAIGCFESIINDFGIRPTIEQCCSMIPLMRQTGKLGLALKIIRELNFAKHAVIWRALLDACQTCRDFNIANIAAAKVIRLEGAEDNVYVWIFNILASCGRWIDSTKLRSL